MAGPPARRRIGPDGADAAARGIRHACEPLPTPDEAQAFDAFVWFDETRAVTPLPSGRQHGAPDTYPFGV